MKIITRSLLLLFALIFFTNIYSQGFLKASGKKIVNQKNENILLKGIGLGGWMLQEGYMLKLQGTNPQFSIRKRIEQLLSKEQTQEFYDTWLSNFVTKGDIDSLHAWGFNSVRLPMHYNLFTLPAEEEPDPNKQTWLTKGFALTDSLLKWCKANKMYLILDLHAAPGGQGNDINISDRDTTKPALWQSDANKNKTIALWKKLAERYKNEPNIGGYDLLNETNWGFDDVNYKHGQKEIHNKALRALLMDITKAIRSVDIKHIIIIEGNSWGNNYKGVFPLWDKNMVISFHKYWNNNDVKSIQYMMDTRNKYNAPIWIGETGENSNVWFTDAVHLYETNNIGWSWWPLKKIGNNNPLEIKSNLNYMHLVNYWNGKTPKPPKESDVYSGLLELAIYTNIHSNIVHWDVIDALF
ncbi:MAG: glycoside hydrolase family 5 protein, partial [Ginsengibacter sp.]